MALKKSYAVEIDEETVERIMEVFGLKYDRAIRKLIQEWVDQYIKETVRNGSS